MSDSASPSSPAIEARRLTKAFGRQRVLRGVDLRVERGDFVALLGSNGAGKTTLMRIVATLSRPTGGDALVLGESVAHHAPRVRQSLGLVSHQTFLYGDLTAEENLRFYGRMYGGTGQYERIGELLERVGLHERRRDPVRTFSRGMQQRLSIARAILHDPPILLLDEPDTGLDQQATRMLGELLALFGAEKRTVLMTTHSLERALQLSRRVAVLAGGQIRYDALTAGMSLSDLAAAYAEITERRPDQSETRR
jgi:heme exporter protein A